MALQVTKLNFEKNVTEKVPFRKFCHICLIHLCLSILSFSYPLALALGKFVSEVSDWLLSLGDRLGRRKLVRLVR